MKRYTSSTSEAAISGYGAFALAVAGTMILTILASAGAHILPGQAPGEDPEGGGGAGGGDAAAEQGLGSGDGAPGVRSDDGGNYPGGGVDDDGVGPPEPLGHNQIHYSDCSLTPLYTNKPTFGPEPTVSGRVQGTKEIVMVGINFTDQNPSSSHDQAFMEDMLVEMDDYYQETSYGQLSLTGDWGGWHGAPNTYDYYGADSGDQHDVNIQTMITHAAGLADPYVDFSQYDANNDGYVDYFIVVHAGGDQALTGDPDHVWSHRGYDLQEPVVDGKRIGYYVTVAESSGLGVFVHEFGHFFGLPDLYDTDYTSAGIGVFGLMSAGPHLNNGETPAHFCAWSKEFLGWVDPIEVDENMLAREILPVETSQEIYKLSISTKEYFLVENRQKTGYDSYLPGEGLLIWHIDNDVGKLEWNNVNNNEGHKRVDLEENGPIQHLDNSPAASGDSSDMWTNEAQGFNSHSDPNSNSYSGAPTELAVESISKHPQNEDSMLADLIKIGRAVSLELKGGGTGVKYIYPGEHIDFAFDITSNRDSGDTVTLEADGTNGEWVTYPDGDAVIEDEFDEVVIRARVTAPDDAIPNEQCIIDLSAVSTDTTRSTPVHLEVIVDEYHAVGFCNPPVVSLDPDNMELVTITVENHGNTQDTFTMEYSIDPGWDVVSAKTSMDIPAFDEKSFDIEIHSPEEADAGTHGMATIKATPGGGGTANQTYVDAVVNQIYGVEAVNTTETHGDEPGGTVSHTVRVTNIGNGADTVNLTLIGVPGHLRASLEENSVKVQPYNHMDVEVHVEIAEDAPADSVGSMFGVKCASSDGLSTAIVYLLVTVEPVYDLEVELGTPDEIEFLPDGSAQFIINVTNMGNAPDTFAFEAGRYGTAIEVELDVEEVELEAGETGAVVVTVTAVEGASADNYDLELEVRTLQGSLKEELTLEAVLAAVHSLDITVENKGTGEPRVSPGNALDFSVLILNNGNSQETLELRAKEVYGLTSSFDDERITLRQDRSSRATLSVEVAQGMSLGDVETSVYAVLADGVETEPVPVKFEVVSGADATDGGDGVDGGEVTGNITDDREAGSGVSAGTIGVIAAVAAIAIITLVIAVVMLRKKGEATAARAWGGSPPGRGGPRGRGPGPGAGRGHQQAPRPGKGTLEVSGPVADGKAGGAGTGAGVEDGGGPGVGDGGREDGGPPAGGVEGKVPAQMVKSGGEGAGGALSGDERPKLPPGK